MISTQIPCFIPEVVGEPDRSARYNAVTIRTFCTLGPHFQRGPKSQITNIPLGNPSPFGHFAEIDLVGAQGGHLFSLGTSQHCCEIVDVPVDPLPCRGKAWRKKTGITELVNMHCRGALWGRRKHEF